MSQVEEARRGADEAQVRWEGVMALKSQVDELEAMVAERRKGEEQVMRRLAPVASESLHHSDAAVGGVAGGGAHGTLLASGSSDNTIKVWDPSDGKLLRTPVEGVRSGRREG